MIQNSIETKNILPACILSLGLIFSGYFIGHGIVNFKYTERTISVKGLAERTVKSDQATWSLKYAYSSDSLPELYTGILNSQEKIKKFMLNKGFGADEIEMQAAIITDNQNNAYLQNNNDKLKRYLADAGVVITTKKIDQAKQAVQQTLELINAGIILNSSYVTYGYTELNNIKSQILDEATANAKKTAESFAVNSNNKLGKIKAASQGQITINDSGIGGTSDLSINKTVRIVTTVTYLLD
jgi:hypothetical protein